MKKLVKIMACAALVGSVLWVTASPKQQNADVTGPGPMSIGKPIAVFETPEPHGIVSYKG
ncbi:hypothetical protein [Tumebacillus flagellatus]|uniref:hypothetical protein n=1 Tax=Tumebacillus flagellatus TaxID=1157490 RepID=UPI000570FA04|nr:hypothetical protein [Tumebacillus flagellatus]